jgi:FkbM family methyltransferase
VQLQLLPSGQLLVVESVMIVTPAIAPPSRRGFLHALGQMPWVHHAVHWLGIYALVNNVLRIVPASRTLPASRCRVRIRSVAGLALAEEMLSGDAYAGLKGLGPVATFVDLGCNVGWFPCMLREYDISAHPIGLLVDADPQMVTEARWHMLTNSIQGECLWGAVGAIAQSSGGATQFHVNPANTSSSLTPFGPDHPYPVKGRVRTIAVPAVAIGIEWRQRFRDQRVDVLKVDVEGAEFEFLRAEGPFLAESVRDIVCEWHAWHGSLHDVVAILDPLGFTLIEVSEQDDKGGVAIFRNSRFAGA